MNLILFKNAPIEVSGSVKLSVSGIMIRETSFGSVWIDPIVDEKPMPCFIEIPGDYLDAVIETLNRIKHERS